MTTTPPTPDVAGASTPNPLELLFGTDFSGARQAADAVSRNIRVEEIDVLDDVDIVANVGAKGVITHSYYVCGEEVQDVSGRFSNSLLSHIGASKSNLGWIEYKDMVGRILASSEKSRKVNVTLLDGVDVGGNPSSERHAFAVTLNDPIPLATMIERLDADIAVMGTDGVMTFAAAPTNESNVSLLGNDLYQMHNYLRVPVDGYGNAARILGNARAACKNGMMLFGERYSSKIKNSSDFMSSLFMSLRTVADDHVKTFSERVGAASVTPMSAFEFRTLVVAMFADRKRYTGGRVMDADSRIKENARWYELMQMLGESILPPGIDWGRVLESDAEMLTPVQCKVSVSDGLNMFTELATHHLNPSGGVASKAEIAVATGKLMSKKRFNLEGVKVESTSRDFWFN